MKLFHIVEIHPQKADARKEFAAQSWEQLYARGEMIPVRYSDYSREAKTSLGDSRDLPYLKDALGMAMDAAGPEDAIVFTNDDNTLHDSAPKAVTEHLENHAVGAWRRCEFRPGQHPAVDAPIEEWVRKSIGHIGHDLFAFRKDWLMDHWNEMPDYVLGASEWDLGVALMIRRYHKLTTTVGNIAQNVFPTEPPIGIVGHEYHPPRWMDADNKDSAPSQKHNRNLLRVWMASYLPTLQFDKSFTSLTPVEPPRSSGGLVHPTRRIAGVVKGVRANPNLIRS
jgi:hypothetical protein